MEEVGLRVHACKTLNGFIHVSKSLIVFVMDLELGLEY